MVCRLDGAKPLSEPMLEYCWTLRNKLQWKFNRNSNIFIQENALENVVCEMASILSRPQCVNRQSGDYKVRYEYLKLSLFRIRLRWADDIIQDGRRNLAKYRGTSSVHEYHQYLLSVQSESFLRCRLNSWEIHSWQDRIFHITRERYKPPFVSLWKQNKNTSNNTSKSVWIRGVFWKTIVKTINTDAWNTYPVKVATNHDIIFCQDTDEVRIMDLREGRLSRKSGKVTFWPTAHNTRFALIKPKGLDITGLKTKEK